jgi:hypothetical protein
MIIEQPRITVLARGVYPDLIKEYGENKFSRIVKNKTILDVCDVSVDLLGLPKIVNVELLAFECGGRETRDGRACCVSDTAGNKAFPFKIARDINGIQGYFCFYDSCLYATCDLALRRTDIKMYRISLYGCTAELESHTVWEGNLRERCLEDNYVPLVNAVRQKAQTLYCTKLHYSLNKGIKK